jgi:hypothetical protein
MSHIGIYASICRHVCRIVPLSSLPHPYDPVDYTVQFCDKCLDPNFVGYYPSSREASEFELQPKQHGPFTLDQEMEQCTTTLAGMDLVGNVTFDGHATQMANRTGKCGVEEYMQQCDTENNDIIYHSIESDSASFSSIDTTVPGAPMWTIETSSHGPSCDGFKSRPTPSGTLRNTIRTTTNNNLPLFELSYDAIRARFNATAERVRMQKLVGQFDAMELQPHPSKLSAEENDMLEHTVWLRARLTEAMMQGEELGVVMDEFEKIFGFGVLDFAGGIEACCEFPMC